MERIKELRDKAHVELDRLAAHISSESGRLGNTDNEFDIEAVTFLIMRLAEKLTERAKALHAEMHRENSWPGEYHEWLRRLKMGNTTCLNEIDNRGTQNDNFIKNAVDRMMKIIHERYTPEEMKKEKNR